jgi:hypothetical protein
MIDASAGLSFYPTNGAVRVDIPEVTAAAGCGGGALDGPAVSLRDSAPRLRSPVPFSAVRHVSGAPVTPPPLLMSRGPTGLVEVAASCW